MRRGFIHPALALLLATSSASAMTQDCTAIELCVDTTCEDIDLPVQIELRPGAMDPDAMEIDLIRDGRVLNFQQIDTPPDVTAQIDDMTFYEAFADGYRLSLTRLANVDDNDIVLLEMDPVVQNESVTILCPVPN